MCDSATSDLMPPKRLRTAGSEEEEDKPCGGHVQEERRGVDVVSVTVDTLDGLIRR